jgi:hypothetical protein
MKDDLVRIRKRAVLSSLTLSENFLAKSGENQKHLVMMVNLCAYNCIQLNFGSFK